MKSVPRTVEVIHLFPQTTAYSAQKVKAVKKRHALQVTKAEREAMAARRQELEASK